MNTFLLNLRKRFTYFLKKHNLFFYWFFIRNIFSITAKYINVICMIFVFFINPLKLYKLSWRCCLPSSKKRDKYKDNLLDLYRPKISTNFQYFNKNTKIFCKGFTKEINFSRSNILVNFNVNNLTKNATFTTLDSKYLDYYIKNNVDVIYIKLILIDQKGNKRLANPFKDYKGLKVIDLKIHTNNTNEHITMGSAIMAILAFYLLSDKTTIYGWNHYQKKDLSKMNLIEFIFKIFFYSRDALTMDCVEYSLTHLFFAYYFKDLKNLIIYGNIDYYKNKLYDKLITKRLIKIFCN